MSEPFFSPGDDLPTTKVDKLVQLHDRDGNDIYPIALSASAVWVPDYAKKEETNIASNNTVNISKTGFLYVYFNTYTVGSQDEIFLYVNGKSVYHNINEADNPTNGARSTYKGFTIPVSAGDIVTANKGLGYANFIPGKWVKVSGGPASVGGGGVAELPSNLTYISENTSGDDVPSLADNNVYSTAETKVGIWTNGKPIYRRVVSTNVSTTGSEASINIAPWNVEYIVNISGGMLTSGSSPEYYPANYVNPLASTAQRFYVKSNLHSNSINYLAGTTGTATIIVEYTKKS